MDGEQRVALVETRTQGDDGHAARLIRYQLGDHLGSVTLELDEVGQVFSYEEYLPVRQHVVSGRGCEHQGRGQAVSASPAKNEMRRQDCTTHGARYYVAWLGWWAKPDPAGTVDGVNLFVQSQQSRESRRQNGTKTSDWQAQGWQEIESNTVSDT